MILCLDLDNVICKTRNVKYKNAKPIARTVKIINKAYNYKFKVIPPLLLLLSVSPLNNEILSKSGISVV